MQFPIKASKANENPKYHKFKIWVVELQNSRLNQKKNEMKRVSYSCLDCIQALAQMPILICSANPSCKTVFPDDSIQLNHLYQAPQLVGNSVEHYHETLTLVEGKQMQGFSVSRTCAIKKAYQHFEQQIIMSHISSQSAIGNQLAMSSPTVQTKTNYVMCFTTDLQASACHDMQAVHYDFIMNA
jgi:DNA-binding winged helix-turn-helix (wHTH) protein